MLEEQQAKMEHGPTHSISYQLNQNMSQPMETGDTGANITATARKQADQIQDENRAVLQVEDVDQ